MRVLESAVGQGAYSMLIILITFNKTNAKNKTKHNRKKQIQKIKLK